MFLPHPRVKVSIVGSLRDREVACSASDRQGSNFEFCVWRTVSSQSSHHPQEVLLAQFSLYVHKGGLKPDSFHFISTSTRISSPIRSLQLFRCTIICHAVTVITCLTLVSPLGVSELVLATRESGKAIVTPPTANISPAIGRRIPISEWQSPSKNEK